MNEPYVTDLERRFSRSKFDQRAARGAALFQSFNIDHEAPIAVIMRNDLAQMEVMRAAALSGTVLVALNWHATSDEVEEICNDCGAKTVVIHRDLVNNLRPALEGRTIIAVYPGSGICNSYEVTKQQAEFGAEYPEWEELLVAHEPIGERLPMRPYLRYTSGSTGRPRGIRRLQQGQKRDFEDLLRRIASEMMGLKPGSRFFTAAPIYHSAPSTLVSAALVADEVSTIVAARFEPEAFLKAIETEKITHIYLVPTMMSRLLKLREEVRNSYDLSSVEYCVSTGSPWPHDLKKSMIEWWGPVFWETYGASEIGFMTMVSSEEALAKPGTAGRMQMGGTVMILDSEGNELPSGEVGEIYVRMDAFGGFDYHNDPEARAAAEKHGHFSVGDLGWLDEDGYLFITDRKKDMIISGGANIFPAEIEAVLIRAAFIRDVAVFGAPHPEFGEQIVAAIEPSDEWEANEKEIMEFLEGKLARFKHPRIIDFHKALPREDSGKIFKPRLREPYWQDAGRKI